MHIDFEQLCEELQKANEQIEFLAETDSVFMSAHSVKARCDDDRIIFISHTPARETYMMHILLREHVLVIDKNINERVITYRITMDGSSCRITLTVIF